ncbi:MAG: formylglycine-generating enzyme family protein [Planctomycetales bacterium]|nr:formylglycine-generating enzyme family protein [Planctomycetales bacterium]
MRSWSQTWLDVRCRHAICIATCILMISSKTRGESSASQQPVVVRNSIEMELIYCPPGRFVMGSPESDPEARPEEKPQVEVEISRGFHLGKYEVTYAQWRAIMQTEPWKAQEGVRESDRAAVAYVSWYDCQEFCSRLSKREGKKYRLPTAAEWEYACRAGTMTRFSFGDDATKLSDYGWWGKSDPNGNAKDEPFTHEVGIKLPNLWGFYDMHGNVWEWCEDADVPRMLGGRDPLSLGESTSNRYIRGGAWWHVATDCRSAYRPSDTPDSKHIDLGFRVTLVPNPHER